MIKAFYNPGRVFLFFILMILSVSTTCGQQPKHFTIEEMYKLAQKNYPLIKQHGLISKTKEYTVANAAKGYLPTFSINGQATYQSAVTSFPFTIPIPGFALPTFSKDQYKIYAEADQLIYDGGAIKNQKENAALTESTQEQNLQIELYALFDRVNQLFFGALLIDEQLKQNDLVKKDLQNGIDRAKALVASGTAYRSNVDELSAQLLQNEQTRIEMNAEVKGYMAMLTVFTNTPLDEKTILEKPPVPQPVDLNNRPELLYYDYQKKTYDLQEDLLNVQLRPKISLFLQGGYGRPGLNFLNNDFQWFYYGGLRLSWNLGGLYTLKNQKQLLDLNRETIDVQKETFLFNTKITLRQQNAEIQKHIDLYKNDSAILALRESVKKAAAAQLQNGVITARDFITEVNAEDEARQSLILHEIQWLQAQYSYQNTLGNTKAQ